MTPLGVSSGKKQSFLILTAYVITSLIFACSPAETPSVATSILPAAPAGSAAMFVSHTIPSVMAPGEKVNVQVVVENTGTVAWDNPAHLAIYDGDNAFGVVYDYIDSPVQPGETSTHTMTLTAPQSDAVFTAEFYWLAPGDSGPVPGDPLNVPVQITDTHTPRYACTFVGTTIPSEVAAGSSQTVDRDSSERGDSDLAG